jgi:uncharacterized membrane protein
MATHSYTFTDLNDPSSTSSTFPLAINAEGQIVGQYIVGNPSETENYFSFIYDHGQFTTLTGLPAGAAPEGINAEGQIVGTFAVAVQKSGPAGSIAADKVERSAALTEWRRAWPLAGLALAATVNVLWVGVLGYALFELL